MKPHPTLWSFSHTEVIEILEQNTSQRRYYVSRKAGFVAADERS